MLNVLVWTLWGRYVLAAERTLIASDALNYSSFNTGLNWDDAQAPKAGNTYVVPGGRTLRTPVSGNHAFAGDGLEIAGTLLWKGPDNASVTITNLVLRGSLNQGQPNSTARIYGNILIPDDASATISLGTDQNDRRQFQIYAPLSGTGSVKLFMPRNSSPMKEVQLAAANTNFSGAITLVGKGKLTLSNENNLGGNPPFWNPAQLSMNGSVLRFSSTLTLDDPNRGIWLSNQTATADDIYPGGRFEVGNGVVATVGCVIGGEGPLEKTDVGTLILAAENTYVGATTVANGTLLVNSATNATVSLLVSPSATLGGTGTLHCAVTVAPGGAITLAGNGYGTFTLAHETGLNLDGATLSFDAQAVVDGPTDCLALGGPLTLSGAGTVSVNIPAAGLPAGLYTLVTYPSISGNGTLVMSYPYPNAELVIGDTAITLEVSGSGATRDMVWKGNASDNTWAFAAGNWLPEDAVFINGVDVRFDDTGVASVPVVLSADAAPRDIAIDTSTKTYALGAGAYVLSARNVTKTGNAALTLKGDHRYASLTIGQASGTSGTGGGACTVSNALDISGSMTVFPSAGTFTQGDRSVLSGAGALTIGCTANLYGTNTFTGTLTIGYSNNTKTVTVYSPRALGATSGGTVIRGGTSSGYNRLTIGSGVTVADEMLTVTGGAGVRAGLWSAGGGGSAWDGDIRIMSDGWLQIGSPGGSTFTIGSLGRTTITNMGASMLSFRDPGNILLNSRLDMANSDINRNDSGTVTLCSVSNRVRGISVSQGQFVLGVSEPFSAAPTLSIGKGDNNTGNKATVDLAGYNLTISRLSEQHYDAFNGTPNEGYQRILCAAPSTLTVNGSLASSFIKAGSIMSGPLTLIKEGSGTLTLGQTNAFTGACVMSNGVLAVTSTGRLGTGATNIVIAGGMLSLSNNLALCEAANVTFAEGGSGVIALPGSVNIKVNTLWYGAKQKYGGTYGASGSGAQFVDDSRFSGTGVLTVTRGSGGTIMVLK